MLLTKKCYYLENQDFGGVNNQNMSLIEMCYSSRLCFYSSLPFEMGKTCKKLILCSTAVEEESRRKLRIQEEAPEQFLSFCCAVANATPEPGVSRRIRRVRRSLSLMLGKLLSLEPTEKLSKSKRDTQ